jgi:hypothetical protein
MRYFRIKIVDQQTYRCAFCLFHALADFFETFFCKEIATISRNRHCRKEGSRQVSFSERVGVRDILGIFSFGRNPDLGYLLFKSKKKVQRSKKVCKVSR